MSDEVLGVWSKVQIVCIWSSWCHCRPQTASFLASFKSILVSPFRYLLAEVVLEKRPLNGCSSSSNSHVETRKNRKMNNKVWNGDEVEKLTVQRVNKSMQRPTKRHMFYDAHTFVVSEARTLECCVEIAVWVLLSAHELSRSQFERCRT